MPFVSKGQERAAFAKHLPFAASWAKMTNYSTLPERVSGSTHKRAAVKRLRRQGLANERRSMETANRKMPMSLPAAEVAGKVTTVKTTGPTSLRGMKHGGK